MRSDGLASAFLYPPWTILQEAQGKPKTQGEAHALVESQNMLLLQHTTDFEVKKDYSY